MIELRSDTFTLPTARMRRSMSEARVGDDVYGQDPTVRALEERAADVTGKESACLMPSGTMANLAAVLTHAPRGSKVLVGAESDIYIYEAGGASVCGGIMYEPIANQPDGRFDLADLNAGFPGDPDDEQFALPSLICVENSQNRCGGKALPVEYMREVKAFAEQRGVPVHLDGARVFNAATALGVEVAEIAAHADSLQFCLSKGLGAPIGSMLVGSGDFIVQARRVRKMLGGGMRQAGIIAAAGLVALDDADRLGEDHANALRLARGLAEIEGIDVDVSAVETNIVMFRVTDSGMTWQAFCESAARGGLSIGELGHGRIRAVLHRDVSEKDVDEALCIVRAVLTGRAT